MKQHLLTETERELLEKKLDEKIEETTEIMLQLGIFKKGKRIENNKEKYFACISLEEVKEIKLIM